MIPDLNKTEYNKEGKVPRYKSDYIDSNENVDYEFSDNSSEEDVVRRTRTRPTYGLNCDHLSWVLRMVFENASQFTKN